MSEINFPINNSFQALKDLKTPEERLKTWNEFLPNLFKLEEELLKATMNVDAQAKICDEDDISKKELIDELSAQHAAFKEKVDKACLLIGGMIHRLQNPLSLQALYILAIRKSMDNTYYGHGKDGSEVWAAGKPKR